MDINKEVYNLNSPCNIKKMQFIKFKDKNQKNFFSDCANYLCEVNLSFSLKILKIF